MCATPVSSEVRVYRGATVESRHAVHVAVVSADGVLRYASGDPSIVAFARSAVKPVQALPLIDDGVAETFGFGSAELALTCASHSGEQRHVELASSMLARIGADETMLACGAHQPFHEPSAQALRDAGREPGRLHNNCSGKHAGMLALARHHGWPAGGYHEAQHPVQQRMLHEMSVWSRVDAAAIATGVDGCGVVTFGLPLEAMARIFAGLARAAGAHDGAAGVVVNAMLAHPDLVAGTDRLCTMLMRTASGRVFAKVGAEGVYCAGIPETGLGVAIKVQDGAVRAAETSLLAVLEALDVLGSEDMNALARWAYPDVMNTREERVGHLEAAVVLERAS